MPQAKALLPWCFALACLLLAACASPRAPGPAEGRPAESEAPPSPPPGALGVAPTERPDAMAWHCTVETSAIDFDADGATQLQTHQRAIQACLRRLPPASCQEVRCSPRP